QPDVVDRDCCLVGKSLDESNLFVGERPDLLQGINAHGTERIIPFKYWHCENCSECVNIFRPARKFRISQDIKNVDGSTFNRGTAGSAVSAGTNWILEHKILERLRSVEGRRHPQ